MNIIAIGGGSLKKRQTLPIDRQIVRLTGTRSRRALFIPTASADDREYCEVFDRVYGGALGCRTDHLLLEPFGIARELFVAADHQRPLRNKRSRHGCQNITLQFLGEAPAADDLVRS